MSVRVAPRMEAEKASRRPPAPASASRCLAFCSCPVGTESGGAQLVRGRAGAGGQQSHGRSRWEHAVQAKRTRPTQGSGLETLWGCASTAGPTRAPGSLMGPRLVLPTQGGSTQRAKFRAKGEGSGRPGTKGVSWVARAAGGTATCHQLVSEVKGSALSSEALPAPLACRR